MKEIEKVLLDLEIKLEEKARKELTEDIRLSRIRLMGYLAGVQEMRIALSHYLREKTKEEMVQESEVEPGDYNTDLIREIVTMHKEVTNILKKANVILMIVNQIKIFGGNENAGEIFGKDA